MSPSWREEFGGLEGYAAAIVALLQVPAEVVNWILILKIMNHLNT